MKSEVQTMGARWAHEKLAAGMNQEEATRLEDATGLYGDASKHPYTDQIGGRVFRNGLLGAGAGALAGGLHGAMLSPGNRLTGAGIGAGLGGLAGGAIGGAGGLAGGALSGNWEHARSQGLRGEKTITPEIAGGLMTGLGGAALLGGTGAMLGGTVPGLVGAGIGALGGGAIGVANARTLRDVGKFRRTHEREAPINALTEMNSMF